MTAQRKFLRRQSAPGRRKFTRFVRLRERYATWRAGKAAEMRREQRETAKRERKAARA